MTLAMLSLVAAHRDDGLAGEHQPVLLEGAVDLRDPLHLTVAKVQVLVVVAVDVNAVATPVLRRVARRVGHAQHARAARGAVDRHQADAHPQAEALVLPHEAEVLDRLAHGVRDAFGLAQRAVLHQDSELVAAEARERVPLADLIAEDHGELAQELIPRLMPAGVVDHLELIQVHVAQRVLAAVPARGVDHALEPPLEVAPVDQPGQGVVRRLVGQLL